MKDNAVFAAACALLYMVNSFVAVTTLRNGDVSKTIWFCFQVYVFYDMAKCYLHKGGYI